MAHVSTVFFIGAGIGLYAVLKPELPGNLMGFRANVQALVYNKGWTMTWTMVWGCLMLAVWRSDKTWEIIRRPWVVTILVLALALWGFAPVLLPATLEPARLYNNRVLDLLVPLLLLPVALILRYRPEWIESKSARLAQMTAILLLVQSLWQLGATWQWQQDVVKLQGLLSSRAGIIPLRINHIVHEFHGEPDKGIRLDLAVPKHCPESKPAHSEPGGVPGFTLIQPIGKILATI